MSLCRRLLLAGLVVGSLGTGAIAAGSKVLLGHVGKATYATPIFARASRYAQIQARVAVNDNLVILKTRNRNWDRVLLNTGRYGYVPSDAVVELPYEVTQNAPSRERMQLSSRSGGASVASFADNFIGTPYVWGGNDVYRGIDCSGFVKKMYGAIGRELPRTAAEQALVGMSISRLEELEPGDRLYFYDRKKGRIGHTGIYQGNGYFIHASSGHGGVAKDYLGSAKWLRILVAARR